MNLLCLSYHLLSVYLPILHSLSIYCWLSFFVSTVCLFIGLFSCLSICPYVSVFLIYVCLFICLLHLCMYLSVKFPLCLFVCLSNVNCVCSCWSKCLPVQCPSCVYVFVCPMSIRFSKYKISDNVKTVLKKANFTWIFRKPVGCSPKSFLLVKSCVSCEAQYNWWAISWEPTIHLLKVDFKRLDH